MALDLYPKYLISTLIVGSILFGLIITEKTFIYEIINSMNIYVGMITIILIAHFTGYITALKLWKPYSETK